MTDITNMDDLIDSRDVIARIEEIEAEIEDLVAEGKKPSDCDDIDELTALKSLAEDAEGYATDWSCGETLIRDSYFKEYAQELAEDIGAVDSNTTWPNSCIDWDQAARELRMDYTGVDFGGVTYWVR